MPALTFLSIAGLVLIALLFVADANLEKNDSPAIVTSQRTGLPEPQYHNAKKTFTNTPAPAPDMNSPAILAAEPKSEREQQPIPAEARAARAEAPAKKVRVEASARKARAEVSSNSSDRRPNTYQQTPFFDRFSIKDY